MCALADPQTKHKRNLRMLPKKHKTHTQKTKTAIETIVAGGSLLQNDDEKDGDGMEGQGGGEGGRRDENVGAGEKCDEHHSPPLSHTQPHSPDEPTGALVSSTGHGMSERERERQTERERETEREQGAQGKSEREGALGNGNGGGKEGGGGGGGGGGNSGGHLELAAKEQVATKSKLKLMREAKAAKEVCV